MTRREIEIIAIVTGAIIIVGIIIWIVSIIKKTSSEQTVESAKKAVKKNDLSFSEISYKAWAERLYMAMKGLGTDENAIYEIIEKLKTPSDWNQLVTDFGIKKSGSFEASLIGWFQDELDTYEMARVNKHLSKIGATI